MDIDLIFSILSGLALIACGAFGALSKDILSDNTLVLPKCENGVISLGFLGGIVIGAAAGYFVDHSPITAFLGGYSGKAIIESLITNKKNG